MVILSSIKQTLLSYKSTKSEDSSLSLCKDRTFREVVTTWGRSHPIWLRNSLNIYSSPGIRTENIPVSSLAFAERIQQEFNTDAPETKNCQVTAKHWSLSIQFMCLNKETQPGFGSLCRQSEFLQGHRQILPLDIKGHLLMKFINIVNAIFIPVP